VIYQIKKNYITGISFALGRVGVIFSHQTYEKIGHLVQPVQLFESTKFCDYWPILAWYISWLVHGINMIHIRFCRAWQEYFKKYPHLVTSALVRAPELQNAEILVQFSRQRIEDNSASCKQTSDKRFEILRQFATIFWDQFFKLDLCLVYICLQNWSKNAKFERKIFFAKHVWVCSEKNSLILILRNKLQ
jgi:hypothetical protein